MGYCSVKNDKEIKIEVIDIKASKSRRRKKIVHPQEEADSSEYNIDG